jgi:hypothetical protein
LGQTNYVVQVFFRVGWPKSGNVRLINKKFGLAQSPTPRGLLEKGALIVRILSLMQTEYDALGEEIERLKKTLNLNSASYALR